MDKSCAFPWSVKFIRLKTDEWKFCCKVPYNSYEDNNLVTEEVKSEFLQKLQPSACNSCWSEENKGGISFRLSEKHAQTTYTDLKNNKHFPRVIDIEFGNVCNMHCMTCGPYNSTTWQQLLYIKSAKDENKIDDTWDKLYSFIVKNQNTISHINMHGGEPSVDPAFSYVINKLVLSNFSKTISTRIITNGNYSENYKLKFERNIQKLVDANRQVEIVFSLDAADKDGEYIRGGLNMNRFYENIKAMSVLNVSLSVNISISILNLENHISVLSALENICLLDRTNININMVNRPHYFSIANLGNKITEFLPKWPENMTNSWKSYKTRFDEFVQPQLESKYCPSAENINELILAIDRYNVIAKKDTTEYYNNLISRLKLLMNN